MVYRIHIKDLRCYGYHGYYKEEQTIGTWFSMDCSFSFELHQSTNDQLTATINYEEVHAILLEEFKIVSQLLEHVLERMQTRLLQRFPHIQDLRLQLTKHHPAMKGVSAVSVELVHRPSF